MTRKLIALAVLASLVSGCATPTFTASQAQNKVNDRVGDATASIATTPRVAAAVREVSEPIIAFKRSPMARKLGDVNVRAASTPFAPMLSEIARKAGYSVVFADVVDASRKVTVEFNNAESDEAIRTTAFLAGYAAVIDRERRIVTVSDVATYTYKVPAAVFETLSAAFESGGDLASKSGGGGGGSSGGSGGGGGGRSGGGGGGGGGSDVAAKFTIKAEAQSTPTNTVQSLLQKQAGPNAEVTVGAGGFVTVRANGQALRRVTDFIKRLCTDAMTQVDIEASVVEVSLANEFAYGIRWEKVLDRATSTTGVATGFKDLLGSSLSVTRTGASSSTIINALQQYSDVQVVSQPRLVSMNNSPANFIEATQIPYLGSLQQTAATTVGGAPTVSGSLSFALDGISLGVVPSVIDNKNVQISLMPVLASVGERADFTMGDSQLTAYKQSNKQTFMRVMAENGKTLILGGIRTNTNKTTTAVASSSTGKKEAKEVVILLRATVIPAPNYDPVVGESI